MKRKEMEPLPDYGDMPRFHKLIEQQRQRKEEQQHKQERQERGNGL